MANRILSLDGGGVWALLQAMCLMDLFGDEPGHTILSEFDLAVGNSGGSIVLGGLMENKRPTEIIALFKDQQNREAIFQRLSAFQRLLSQLPVFPRYSTARKLEGLRHLFGALGDRPLGSFGGAGWPKSPNGQDVRILIVALDYDALRARFFRSYGTGHGATPDTIPLVEAVHASSDAPISYFDQPADWDQHRYWDGAMAGMNNPLLAGLIDLLGTGISGKDIIVLSLGTGTTKLVPPQAQPPAPWNLAEKRPSAGIVENLKRAAGCILDDPPDTSTFASHVILANARGADARSNCAVVRLSPLVRPVLDPLDQAWKVPPGLSEQEFDALQALEMDAIQQSQVQLIETLGNSWMADRVPNQPIRMQADDLRSSVGEECYTLAKERWKTLCTAP